MFQPGSLRSGSKPVGVVGDVDQLVGGIGRVFDGEAQCVGVDRVVGEVEWLEELSLHPELLDLLAAVEHLGLVVDLGHGEAPTLDVVGQLDGGGGIAITAPPHPHEEVGEVAAVVLIESLQRHGVEADGDRLGARRDFYLCPGGSCVSGTGRIGSRR